MLYNLAYTVVYVNYTSIKLEEEKKNKSVVSTITSSAWYYTLANKEIMVKKND